MLERDDLAGLGPKMRLCDERERRFVRAVLDYPTATQTKWARIAGYSSSSAGSLKVQGHKVSHRRRVLDAVAEETGQYVWLGGAIGIAGLVKIAMDPTH
jgi:hypothetical protein